MKRYIIINDWIKYNFKNLMALNKWLSYQGSKENQTLTFAETETSRVGTNVLKLPPANTAALVTNGTIFPLFKA